MGKHMTTLVGAVIRVLIFFHRSKDGFMPLPMDSHCNREDENYGKYIKVAHDGGWMSLYSNCSDIQAEVGSAVKQGDRLGKMGANSSGTYQLHFETWKDEQPVDPLPLIRRTAR